MSVTAGGSAVWNAPATGTFSFSSSASGYLVNNQTFTVSTTTTSIQVCLNPATVTITVVDCGSLRALSTSSSVLITSTTISYSSTVTVSGGGIYTWTIPSFGSYSFQTTATGYLTNTQSFTVSATTGSLQLCVNPAQVQIDVRNAYTNVSIEVGATITYSGVISGSLRWNGVTTFTHGGYGSYSFTAVPDSKYQNGNLNYQISSTTTLIIIYVQPNPIPVTVVNCNTLQALGVTASVLITSTSVSYSTSLTVSSGGSASWSFPSYGSFSFQTTASGYTTSTTTQSVSTTTNGIQLCVSPATVQLDVRDALTNVSIEVGATVSYTGVISGSLRWTGITTFTHGGFGSYSFTAVPDSKYQNGNLNYQISSTTTLIIIYVQPNPIPVTVVNCNTLQALGVTASVLITSTSVSYSTSLTVSSGGSASWSFPSYGSFSFQTTASGYTTSTTTQSVSTTTNGIQLCVSPATVQLDVRDALTNVSIEVGATVSYTGVISGSLRWTGITTFTHGGFGSYSFTAVPDSRYSNGNLNTQITSTTTLIIIYVQAPPIPITVVNCNSLQAITTTASVQISSGTYISAVSVTAGGSASWSYPFYGTFSFATSASKYTSNTQTFSIASTTSSVQVCVYPSCGNFHCDAGETASSCPGDCVAIFFEFENADGSGPVNQPTVNYFLSPPLDANADTGPNRNGIQAATTRTTGNGSNTVLEETYSYNILVWVEVVVNSFINFYWRVNTSYVDPALGTYRLRVHLSKLLGSTDFNYRLVNTWKPIDATPEPYGPTDLNLHLFHPAGALDINNPTLLSGGFAIGKAVADSKQSGGPATMDISPGSSSMVGVWNSKPPRSSVIAPSQNNRYLVDSGSYVVFYGKTSNAANGKQLGQVVMDEIFLTNPSAKTDHTSDLWYVAQFTVNQPAVNQPNIVGQSKFKQSTVNSNRDMIFDCEVYTYCSAFVVPYSDTGRRAAEI